MATSISIKTEYIARSATTTVNIKITRVTVSQISTIFTHFLFFFPIFSHIWPNIARPSGSTGDTEVPNEGISVVGVASKNISKPGTPLHVLSSVIIAGSELWASKQSPNGSRRAVGVC